MVVYRIVKEKYAKELSASGIANRWNIRGEKVIYCSQNIALATLEMLVHRAFIHPKSKYQLLSIRVPEESIEEIKLDNLPSTWRSLSSYPKLQAWGSNWYQQRESLILKVPSAVIPQEANFLINYNHPLFKEVEIIERTEYFWDDRFR